MTIPEWLFQEPNEIKPGKVNSPKSMKKKARDNIKLDDKTWNEKFDEKVIDQSILFY